MGYRDLKKKRWFRILSNKYVLLILLFGIWMIFLDSNSWIVQNHLSNKIDKLKANKSYYKKEIAHDSLLIHQLNDTEGLERFAREKYYMKRKNEEVYIIDFQDSSQQE